MLIICIVLQRIRFARLSATPVDRQAAGMSADCMVRDCSYCTTAW